MRFLNGIPAIFHNGALIIGDTHFGMENKLRQRGIFSNDFSERLAKKIVDLVKKTKAKKLILLGDVKEDITYLDEYTVHAFEIIKKETEKLEIMVVRGNHDGGIESLGLKTIPSDGFVYKGLGLVHGHSWPSEECMNAKYLVSTHQHPQIEIVDLSGKRHVEPVWVIAEVDNDKTKKHYKKFSKKIKLILMPAFNPIVGNPIKNDADSHLGPILNNKLFKWNDAIVYRLNGVAVGKLSSICSAKNHKQ